MSKAADFIQFKLQQRTENGSLRKLSSSPPPIDFCSNDYLGFAGSSKLQEAINTALKVRNLPSHGSGGSRLLSGNNAYVEETEAFIANFHDAESGLIFNSGYDANVGLLSSLGQKGDTIICDELIHASLIDGARLTHANRYTFKHNDPNHLEEKLTMAKGVVYVVVESIYSMDGDAAPLQEIAVLCSRYGANLIVDEAHATGVFGDHGTGRVQLLNLQQKIFARIVTFGKAVGCHGAIVLGSKQLREYLINFARSFIYTTAVPLHQIVAIRCAYEQLKAIDHTPLLQQKICHYLEQMNQWNHPEYGFSSSPIQTLILPGNTRAKNAAASLQAQGFDVRAILSPTVAEGKERLRICLHTFNTDQEIDYLTTQIKDLHL